MPRFTPHITVATVIEKDGRFLLIEEDEARRETIRDRQMVQNIENTGVRLRRETFDGDARNELVADLGRVTGPEILTA